MRDKLASLLIGQSLPPNLEIEYSSLVKFGKDSEILPLLAFLFSDIYQVSIIYLMHPTSIIISHKGHIFNIFDNGETVTPARFTIAWKEKQPKNIFTIGYTHM